jgi:hypothetical protein
MSKYFIVEPPTTPVSTPVYDYGSVYTTIANQLASIDTDTTGLAATVLLIATSLGTVASNSTTIATKLTAIETYQQRMKELAETTGIRIVGPYEWLGFIPSYINYIEKGEILETDGSVSPEQVAAALEKLTEYFEKINSLPTNF